LTGYSPDSCRSRRCGALSQEVTGNYALIIAQLLLHVIEFAWPHQLDPDDITDRIAIKSSLILGGGKSASRSLL